MLRELVVFVPLAVVTNTLVPFPFDYVLLWFSADTSFAQSIWLASAGAACAGVGALLDVWLLQRFGERLLRSTRYTPIAARRSFYAIAALYALLPLPYSGVRVLLLRERPNRFAYAGVTAAARWPRFILIAQLGRSLFLPTWAVVSLMILSVLYVVARYHGLSQRAS
jgi:hypothetical protein